MTFNKYAFFWNWSHVCLIHVACLIQVATMTGFIVLNFVRILILSWALGLAVTRQYLCVLLLTQIFRFFFFFATSTQMVCLHPFPKYTCPEAFHYIFHSVCIFKTCVFHIVRHFIFVVSGFFHYIDKSVCIEQGLWISYCKIHILLFAFLFGFLLCTLNFNICKTMKICNNKNSAGGYVAK